MPKIFARAGRWFLFLMLLQNVSLAGASVVLPLSIEAMSTQSTLIVRARVLGQTAAWGQGKERIYTQTRLVVEELLHGTMPTSKQFVVRTLGGEVGDVGMKVAGTPHFEVGEKVALFLRVDPGLPSAFQVIGMSQGKYRIESVEGVEQAIPNFEGLAFMQGGRANPTLKVEAPMRWHDLRTRIQNALAAQNVPASSSVPVTVPGGNTSTAEGTLPLQPQVAPKHLAPAIAPK